MLIGIEQGGGEARGGMAVIPSHPSLPANKQTIEKISNTHLNSVFLLFIHVLS